MKSFNDNKLHVITWLFALLLAGCGGSGSAGGPAADNSSGQFAASTAPLTSAGSTSGTVERQVTSTTYQAVDINLAWPIPDARSDGTALALSDIAGYDLAYSNSVNETTIISIDDPQSTSYRINQLPPDDYEFVVFAYDTDNAISAPSPTVTLSKTSFPLL